MGRTAPGMACGPVAPAGIITARRLTATSASTIPTAVALAEEWPINGTPAEAGRGSVRLSADKLFQDAHKCGLLRIELSRRTGWRAESDQAHPRFEKEIGPGSYRRHGRRDLVLPLLGHGRALELRSAVRGAATPRTEVRPSAGPVAAGMLATRLARAPRWGDPDRFHTRSGSPVVRPREPWPCRGRPIGREENPPSPPGRGPTHFVDLLMVGGFVQAPPCSIVQNVGGIEGGDPLLDLTVEALRSRLARERHDRPPLGGVFQAGMLRHLDIPGLGPPLSEQGCDPIREGGGQGSVREELEA